ncbi:polysaccharide pyruvyl transferase family protein [Lysobacter sp. A289]
MGYKILLTGQRDFGNRGCEAIVRSTVGLLRSQYSDAKVLVPSENKAGDQALWPDAEAQGVEFVRAYRPLHTRPWIHAQRLPFAALKQAGWPFPAPDWLRRQVASVDLVMSIGGDNYSLDYRLPSLLMGVDKLAMDLGKPLVLWGASVGPFERDPLFVPAVSHHFSRMSLIGVREHVSYRYLTEQLGLKNVIQMADPAFTLIPQAVDRGAFWPQEKKAGVLGINISPLIERYVQAGQNIVSEVISFIHSAVERQGLAVLLIPHVVPLGGKKNNNDAIYMKRILDGCRGLGGAVTMTPAGLNAVQIKSVVSHLRFFMGARTHSTIAALSSGVPTVSIAYSVKALGINRDIFGNTSAVIETPMVSERSLSERLNWLLENEGDLRKRLSVRVPELQASAMSAAATVGGLVR